MGKPYATLKSTSFQITAFFIFISLTEVISSPSSCTLHFHFFRRLNRSFNFCSMLACFSCIPKFVKLFLLHHVNKTSGPHRNLYSPISIKCENNLCEGMGEWVTSITKLYSQLCDGWWFLTWAVNLCASIAASARALTYLYCKRLLFKRNKCWHSIFCNDDSST